MAINGSGAKPAKTAALIWQIAELLRGDVRPADYGSFILPLTVLRRLDCVLEKTKPAVVKVAATIKDLETLSLQQRLALEKAANAKFYNASPMTLTTALADPNHLRANVQAYIGGFSPNIRDVFERYKTDDRIAQLDEMDLLLKVLKEFVAVDLHPDVVDNSAMGDAFENLIRRFAESSNETAGDHYTPRDAIRLMVDLLLAGDTNLLTNKIPLRSVYDPTAGTGGMLSVAEDRIKKYNANASVTAYAQELNDESYAICKADMVIKGQNVNNVKRGNTLSNDEFKGQTFDLMFSNPPYGVDWKKVQEAVEQEHMKNPKGRFGPGLPRISDGQMLFLLHLVSKMHSLAKNPNGSRIAIVMNGSPLFSGGAGSGESDIRKYLFENDLVEAIVGLPTEMFYNTPIATHIWILSNSKTPNRLGMTQLIDGTSFWKKMPKSLGNKRRFMDEDDDIAQVVRIYGEFEDGEFSKVLPNGAFGYRTITVERPLRLNFQVTPERLRRLDVDKVIAKNGLRIEELKSALTSIGSAQVFKSRPAFLKALDLALTKSRINVTAPQYKAIWQAMSERDESAEVCTGAKGKMEPDADLRDTENVPLMDEIEAYFAREVEPYVPDAWIDFDKTKIGYEIPFARYFYKYLPPRSLANINTDLAAVTSEIVEMLREAAV